jgi:hypothetical protein
MSSNRDNHDPSDSETPAPNENEAKPSGDPDSSVISVTTFISPKGNVYRITRTNEVDDYERPPDPTKE